MKGLAVKERLSALAPDDLVLQFLAVQEIDILRTRYTFVDEPEVCRFLSANPEVMATLICALPHLDHVFGALAPKTLLLVDDPETNGGEELSVLIATYGEIDDELDRLANFLKNWAADEVNRLERKLNFDVVFP